MTKSTSSPEFKLKAVQNIATHCKRPAQICREYNVFAPRCAVGLSGS
jgi:transposase-like protein